LLNREVATNIDNIDRLMAFAADDIVSIRPNKPALIGKEANQSDGQQFFDRITIQENDIVKAVHVSGDLAVVHVDWSGVFMPKAGGES
jgi:ketosteroid isomerase-like protein